MVLRSTRIAPTILTQVGHEGNPSLTLELTVEGVLDGAATLSVHAVEISDETRNALGA